MPSENDCFPNMPSDEWIDLTALQPLTIYTAPGNGYFAYRVQSGNSYLAITNINSSVVENEVMGSWLLTNGGSAYIPVKKGETIKLSYTQDNFAYFRFIYAQGQASIIKY